MEYINYATYHPYLDEQNEEKDECVLETRKLGHHRYPFPVATGKAFPQGVSLGTTGLPRRTVAQRLLDLERSDFPTKYERRAELDRMRSRRRVEDFSSIPRSSYADELRPSRPRVAYVTPWTTTVLPSYLDIIYPLSRYPVRPFRQVPLSPLYERFIPIRDDQDLDPLTIEMEAEGVFQNAKKEVKTVQGALLASMATDRVIRLCQERNRIRNQEKRIENARLVAPIYTTLESNLGTRQKVLINYHKGKSSAGASGRATPEVVDVGKDVSTKVTVPLKRRKTLEDTAAVDDAEYTLKTSESAEQDIIEQEPVKVEQVPEVETKEKEVSKTKKPNKEKVPLKLSIGKAKTESIEDTGSTAINKVKTPTTPVKAPPTPTEPTTIKAPLTPIEPTQPIKLPLTPEPKTPTTIKERPLTPTEPTTPVKAPPTPAEPTTPSPKAPLTPEPKTPITPIKERPLTPTEPTTPVKAPTIPTEPTTPSPKAPLTPEPKTPTTPIKERPLTPVTPSPKAPLTPTTPIENPLESPTTPVQETPTKEEPTQESIEEILLTPNEAKTPTTPIDDEPRYRTASPKISEPVTPEPITRTLSEDPTQITDEGEKLDVEKEAEVVNEPPETPTSPEKLRRLVSTVSAISDTCDPDDWIDDEPPEVDIETESRPKVILSASDVPSVLARGREEEELEENRSTPITPAIQTEEASSADETAETVIKPLSNKASMDDPDLDRLSVDRASSVEISASTNENAEAGSTLTGEETLSTDGRPLSIEADSLVADDEQALDDALESTFNTNAYEDTRIKEEADEVTPKYEGDWKRTSSLTIEEQSDNE